MPSVHLDERLKTAADFVRLDKKIADIGTDHALLPCYLYQNGAREIIAADINENPLKAAQATLDLYGISGIKLIKSDGLEQIPPCDDIIIAGMGGELIAEIVLRCGFLHINPHFILQPMTRAEVLRRELYKAGFEILSEKTAVAAGKIYTVMLVVYCGQKREIDEKFAYCGKNGERLYLEKQVKTLRKKALGNGAYGNIAQEIENGYGK